MHSLAGTTDMLCPPWCMVSGSTQCFFFLPLWGPGDLMFRRFWGDQGRGVLRKSQLRVLGQGLFWAEGVWAAMGWGWRGFSASPGVRRDIFWFRSHILLSVSLGRFFSLSSLLAVSFCHCEGLRKAQKVRGRSDQGETGGCPNTEASAGGWGSGGSGGTFPSVGIVQTWKKPALAP